MSRINTNVDSIIAFNNLNRANNNLGVTLTRLSTGTRVNSSRDDPAGLFAGEFLRQELTSINSAIQNNNRANNVLSTADANLGQIADLLNGIQGLLTTSANKGVLSEEELRANQSQIDAAIGSVNRISQTAQFAGKKLLDGSLGFQLSGLNRFDAGNATFTNVQVNVANFDANQNPITVQVTLTTRASQATVTVSSLTAGADSTIEVVGNRGSITLNIGSGQSVQAAVNGVSDVTGVTASGTLLRSIDYGRDSLVKITNRVGSLISTSETSDLGSDAVGTINGNAFSANGLTANLQTVNLDVSVTFSAGAANGSISTFQVTSGGARFQLGQKIDIANQINIGLSSFQAISLGSIYRESGGTLQNRTLASLLTGGTNDLLNSTSSTTTAGKLGIAADIVSDALRQVTNTRSRIGSIQANTIAANLQTLSVTQENISAARSAIVDTDFALETANLTRQQIIVQASTSAQAIANSRPQAVLTLLGR